MVRPDDYNIPGIGGSRSTYTPLPSLSAEEVAQIYSNISHFLPKDLKEYLERMLKGEASTDALKDLEIFFRLVTIYSTHAVLWAIEDKKVTKDIGSILGEVRQGAVAIENMKNKRTEMTTKREGADEGGMDFDARKSSMEFFENLHRRSS